MEQKRRRLALVANNSRFLILPEIECPNLATRVLGLCLGRLSEDWQAHYGHPILVVESFVDSQLFRGTCYKAQGWSRLGQTKGFGRCSQDTIPSTSAPRNSGCAKWWAEPVSGCVRRACRRGCVAWSKKSFRAVRLRSRTAHSLRSHAECA